MFTSISLTNFKGLKRVHIPLKRINVFVGKNGSGKSSVLHALSVLKQSSKSQSQVVLNLGYINLGSFPDILGEASECSIEVEATSKFESKALPMSSGTNRYYCNLTFDIQGLLSYKTKVVTPSNTEFTNIYHRYGGSLVQPTALGVNTVNYSLQVTNYLGYLFQPSGFSYSRNLSNEEQRLATETYSELGRFASSLQAVLQRVYIVPTIRGLIEPLYQLLDRPSEEIASSSGLREMGAALSTNLMHTRGLPKRISDLEERITNVQIDAFNAPGHMVAIKNPKKNTYMVNEGFGSSQLLFLLERLVISSRDSLIGVEEPEIHLHPTSQWELSNVICDIAKSENKQMIITTHSEHIIYPILGRIAKAKQGDIRLDDVALFSFEINDETGVIEVKQLEIDAKGRVSGGLQGFIDANLKALDSFISE